MNKSGRVSDGRETVSAPEDRESRWNRGERQRGETPMEVFPRGTLVLVFWLKFQYLHKLSFKRWRGESLRGKGVAKRFENNRKES